MTSGDGFYCYELCNIIHISKCKSNIYKAAININEQTGVKINLSFITLKQSLCTIMNCNLYLIANGKIMTKAAGIVQLWYHTNINP